MECDVGDFFVSRKDFFMSLPRCNLGEADHGPTSSVLPLSTTVHSREGKDGKVCRWNGPAKAFSQLENTSYWDSISLADIVAVTSHLGVEVPNITKFKTRQIKNMAFWTKSQNLMPTKFADIQCSTSLINTAACNQWHHVNHATDKARYKYTYQPPTKYYIAECSTVGLRWASA